MTSLLRAYMRNIIESAIAPDDLSDTRKRVVDYLYNVLDTVWRPIIEQTLNNSKFGDVEFSDEKRLYHEHGGIRGTIHFTHPKFDVEYRLDYIFRVLINVKQQGGYYTEFRFQMPLVSRYNLDEKLLGSNLSIRGPVSNGVILTTSDIEHGSKVHELFVPVMRQILEFEEHEQI